MCCNIQAEDGAGSKMEARQAVHICNSEIWGYEGEEKDEIRVSHNNLKDRVTIDSMGSLRVRPENVHNVLNLECLNTGPKMLDIWLQVQLQAAENHLGWKQCY